MLVSLITHCCGMASQSSTRICRKSANVVVLVTLAWTAGPNWSHKCVFPTNVRQFKREINRLSNRIGFIARKHFYHKKISDQTQVSLLFVLHLYITTGWMLIDLSHFGFCSSLTQWKVRSCGFVMTPNNSGTSWRYCCSTWSKVLLHPTKVLQYLDVHSLHK